MSGKTEYVLAPLGASTEVCFAWRPRAEDAAAPTFSRLRAATAAGGGGGGVGGRS